LSIDVRRAILINLGASRLPESAEFLLAAVANEAPTLAETAISALAASRFGAEMRARAAEAVAARGDLGLQAHFDERFPAGSGH
jgi:hypothetical protein